MQLERLGEQMPYPSSSDRCNDPRALLHRKLLRSGNDTRRTRDARGSRTFSISALRGCRHDDVDVAG
jgi:hypothetical protein